MAVRDRLRKYVAQYLVPGEEIQAGFYAKRPGVGYNDCAVVATDRRLLLLGLNFYGPAQGLVSEAPRRIKLGPCSGRTQSIDAFGIALTVDRRFFKDVAEADRAAEQATNAAEQTRTVAPTRCLECGMESTGATATCVRCGAPVSLPPPAAVPPEAGWNGSPVPPSAAEALYWTPGQPYSPSGQPYWTPGQQPPAAAPAAGWYGSPASPPPQDAPYWPYWPPGQPPPRPGNSRRKLLIGGGVGSAVLIALIAVIVVAVSSSSGKSAQSANELAWYQLQTGDCLAGANMGLGSTSPWPDTVTKVACTKPHEAEVFFAGAEWPQSLAYPGKSTIDDQASAACDGAFEAYDGTALNQSAFSDNDIFDDSSADWAAGSRSLVCVAFEPGSGPSGAEPLDYSIKGSDK